MERKQFLIMEQFDTEHYTSLDSQHWTEPKQKGECFQS